MRYWSSASGKEVWKLSRRAEGGIQELTREEREIVAEREKRYAGQKRRADAMRKYLPGVGKGMNGRGRRGKPEGEEAQYGGEDVEPEVEEWRVKALGEMSDVEFQEFRESTYMEIARKGDSHDGVRMKAIEAAQKMRDQMKFGTRAAVEATLAACRKRRAELDEIERQLAAVETSESEGGRETPAQQSAQEHGTQPEASERQS